MCPRGFKPCGQIRLAVIKTNLRDQRRLPIFYRLAHPEVIGVSAENPHGLLEGQFDFEAQAIEAADLDWRHGQIGGDEDQAASGGVTSVNCSPRSREPIKPPNLPGKPGCACMDPVKPKKHGPFYQLSYSHQGKSTTRFVRPGYVTIIRKEITAYKRFMKLTRDWVALSIAVSQLQKEGARKKEDKKQVRTRYAQVRKAKERKTHFLTITH